MCDFKQREYKCGHMRWLATKHCNDYINTGTRKCPPNILDFEESPMICAECQPKPSCYSLFATTTRPRSKPSQP